MCWDKFCLNRSLIKYSNIDFYRNIYFIVENNRIKLSWLAIKEEELGQGGVNPALLNLVGSKSDRSINITARSFSPF